MQVHLNPKWDWSGNHTEQLVYTFIDKGLFSDSGPAVLMSQD